MKPGARARPAPSISRAPRSATRPTAAMRPPLTARSPRAASWPLPSQRSAPRMTRSAMGALVAGRGARRQGRRAATPGGVSRRGTVASLGAGGARPGAVVRPDVRLGVALALRRGLRVAALLALRRGLRVAALEVTPRELGAPDRLIAGRERERRGEELPDAHQGARDDHAEPLREAERDALAVAARAALGHDVARHLQDRGRHASEPAPELAGGRLRAGGRGEEENQRCKCEPACHVAPPRAWRASTRRCTR